MVAHHQGYISTKVNVTSYIVQYPVFMITQTDVCFIPWQICSVEHRLGFSGKYSATSQLIREDYSYTNIYRLYSQIYSYI